MPASGLSWHKPAMLPFAPDPDVLSDCEIKEAKRHPERGTVILAAAGAALTLGEQHPATVALSRASETMDRVDLWRSRLALKRLRKDQREAIAEAVEE